MNVRNVRARAFTLIELLVVVSVIALLMAILVPSLSSAQKRARQVVCMSNLREASIGLRMYIHDEEDRLPYVDSALFEPGGVRNWDADPSDEELHPQSLVNVLKVYLGNPKVFICPSAKIGYPIAKPQVTYRSSAADNHTGYAHDYFLSDDRPGYNYNLKYLDGRNYELKFVDILRPGFPLVDGPGPYYLLRDFIVKNAEGRPVLAHGDRYNQLYLDLRVEEVRDPVSLTIDH